MIKINYIVNSRETIFYIKYYVFRINNTKYEFALLRLNQ